MDGQVQPGPGNIQVTPNDLLAKIGDLTIQVDIRQSQLEQAYMTIGALQARVKELKDKYESDEKTAEESAAASAPKDVEPTPIRPPEEAFDH